MKKKMFVLLPMCLLLVGCSLFGKDNDAIREIYLNVLSNEITYLNQEKKSKFISEYTKQDFGITRYAIVDFNGDNVDDMVVELQNNDEETFYLLLHYYKNKVYGVKVDSNKMQSIVKDGHVFRYDFKTETTYWDLYTFEKGKLVVTEKHRYDSKSTECLFDGKKMDCSEYVSKYNSWMENDIVQVDWKTY